MNSCLESLDRSRGLVRAVGGLTVPRVCRSQTVLSFHSRDPQRFQELAVAAAKEKAGLVRKKIGDEKADVTCRYDLFK